MDVTEVMPAKPGAKSLAFELRVVTRARDCPDISNDGYAERLKERGELASVRVE